VVRILLLVWATERYGQAILGTEDNPSFLHLACGYAVYLVGLLLMLGLIALLNSAALKKWLASRGITPGSGTAPGGNGPIVHPAE
jgi:hypothetical protein